ncbi:hypothetical protein CDD83_7804 [Cordyceps sp. RAO-2017]|nr:hypothetical protein CDD83_7804 [Cordyceps sp. RAO-2017]
MSSPASPPPGLPPQEDHSGPLQAVWWTCFAVATTFILLRVWARLLRRSLGYDDVTMGLAWLCFVADMILVHYIAVTGRTQHLQWIAVQGGVPAVERMLELYVVVLAVGIFLTGLGKVAIGITILRIIGNTSKWQRAAVWIVLFLTVATCIIDFCLSVFRCGLPRNTWTIASWSTAQCVPSDVQTNINTWANSVQVFADFAFSILPMAIVYGLRIPPRHKRFLIVALGLTLITGAAGTLKTVYAATMDHADLSYAIFPSLVWFAVESMLIFVCGSVPALYPLYESYMKPRRLGYGSHGSAAKLRASSKTAADSSGYPGSKASASSNPSSAKRPWTTTTTATAGSGFGDSSVSTAHDEEAPDMELAHLTTTQLAATSVSTMPRPYDPNSWRRGGQIAVVREVAVSSSRGRDSPRAIV